MMSAELVEEFRSLGSEQRPEVWKSHMKRKAEQPQGSRHKPVEREAASIFQVSPAL